MTSDFEQWFENGSKAVFRNKDETEELKLYQWLAWRDAIRTHKSKAESALAVAVQILESKELSDGESVALGQMLEVIREAE